MERATLDSFGALFAEALAEILAKTAGATAQVLAREPDSGFDEIVGMMNLAGKNAGMVFLSAPEADVRRLCCAITGTPLNEVTPEDVDDTLCELVNMMAGNVKLRLGSSEYSFTLATPVAMRGKGMTVATEKRFCMVLASLGGEAEEVRLKVIYSSPVA